MSSIRGYVTIDPSAIRLTAMAKTAPDEAWQTTVLSQDETLRMPEIGIEIPVDKIYEGITFPDQDAAPA